MDHHTPDPNPPTNDAPAPTSTNSTTGAPVVVVGTPLARAADVAARLRSGGTRLPAPVARRRPLDELLPAGPPAPALTYTPTSRVLSDDYRFSAYLDGPTGRVHLDAALGWSAGPLVAHADGWWQVLTPDRSGTPVKRNDGRCSLTPNGRVRLSLSVADALGVRPRGEVLVLALPEHDALALCPTTALFCGAPLSLLSDTSHCDCERNHHGH